MKHYEYEIQCRIFEWANLQCKKYPCLKYLVASLNGVKLSNIKQGYRAKRAGMKKGFPDLFLPLKNKQYAGLFIELKTNSNKALNIKKGNVSQDQKNWINYLNDAGYRAVVCYGFNETVNEIENYIISI